MSQFQHQYQHHDPMTKAKPQEVFDKTASHLLKHGKFGPEPPAFPGCINLVTHLHVVRNMHEEKDWPLQLANTAATFGLSTAVLNRVH
jgi:hypothetical protein